MTDQPTEPPPPLQPAQPAPLEQPARPRFEQRVDDFGQRAEAAGERLGRDAQAAGARWSKEPAVAGAADTAARVWGLILIAVGLWFFADVTLGLDMPAVAWRELWPIVLIVIGLAIVLRGLARRRA